MELDNLLGPNKKIHNIQLINMKINKVYLVSSSLPKVFDHVTTRNQCAKIPSATGHLRSG